MAQTITNLDMTEDNVEIRRTDVLICGGGISGLSLAAWLRRAGVEIHLLDKNVTPGGVIGTVHKDGFTFERGPNTILDKYESFDELIAWGGLEQEIIRVPMHTQTRHLWLNGRLREVPTNPLAFAASGVLSPTAKLALFREPFIAPREGDESVADFVTRRLGRQWLDNLITPVVSGIWAGNPERLSILHAFPVMKQMEADGGSLIRGAMRRMKRAKNLRRETGKPRRTKNLVSFRDGLDRLPVSLADRLGERYHASTRILDIQSLGPDQGFAVNTMTADGNSCRWEARDLVIAAEADRAAEWLEGLDSEIAATLRSFPYNRLVAVGLGIDSTEARIPVGFGFLAPRNQGVRILGTIVNSNFLPGRAPKGCAAMTIFIGGDLDQSAYELDDDEITGLVKRDLRKALGWNGQPRSLHIERWPRAIPQYDMRHGARLSQIDAAEGRWPGLHLLGNWRGGVSIGDRVDTTARLSQKILERRA